MNKFRDTAWPVILMWLQNWGVAGGYSPHCCSVAEELMCHPRIDGWLGGQVDGWMDGCSPKIIMHCGVVAHYCWPGG